MRPKPNRVSRRRTARRRAPRRSPSYYTVAGVNLHEEMDRLRELPAFAGGELARRRPELKVRRAARRPNRLGFAILDEWRLSVTAYPGIRPGDAQETLLHELVHLHVGTEPGHHRWHGRRFRAVLRRAIAEGYRIHSVRPRSTLHGAYADAIERRRRRTGPTRTGRAAVPRGQLALPLPEGLAGHS
jgi:predicted SprT family Zn-dependent metalloprotease